jgi:ABC-type dipeptide/oligopeptide/nickel transport system permease component
VLVFNFFLFRVLPGDSAALLLRGTSAFNPQNLEALRADLGLDEPLPEQFLIYVGDTARFNFGGSFYYRGAPVSEVIASRIWPTFLLLGTVMIASAACPVRTNASSKPRTASTTASTCSSAATIWPRAPRACSIPRCRWPAGMRRSAAIRAGTRAASTRTSSAFVHDVDRIRTDGKRNAPQGLT